MRADQIMSAPVVTARAGDPVGRVAALLADHGFTALPVVEEDDRLIGLVTEADLLAGRFPADARRPATDEERPARPPRTVEDVMTTPAVAVGAGTDVAVLARLMLADRRRCLPVVSGSRLVGVVTRRDLVRLLTRPDPEVAADVRRRLRGYGGPHRWRVAVDAGSVTITDQFAACQGAAVDRHVARVLAESVPGVVRADVMAADAGSSAGPEVGAPGDAVRTLG
ncbi:CBS domain-containing protein [Actinokineospora bangkokensis]|uniref:CBS domain-containing protein n=1 Tax=Actinokineospora bangkokensis TaxID=1193682 RepID=A0A1Q9LQZ8_9PSEU|nr:CBS domain-containing protein [Actinokineospora bangkokensis]OLR94466.1 hypothetical protein BJP25_11995 [Actinokineospora bangkokensis]